MQWCRTVALCLVLVTAGCAALDAGPERIEATASTPPGLENGTVDAKTLVTAHEQSIAGTAVTLSITRVTASREHNRTVRTRVWVTDNGTTRRLRTVESDTSSRRTEHWFGPERGYRRIDGQDPTAVNASLSPRQRYRTDRLEYWLTAGEYTITVVGESPDRYALTAEEFTPPDGRQLEADTVRYESTGIVTETGRIVAFSTRFVRIERNKWGRHVRSQTYTYRVVETGQINVGRPSWVGNGTEPLVRNTDG